MRSLTWTVGCRHRGIGRSAVADLPMIDVIGLVLAVVAQDLSCLQFGDERIDDRLERFILDLDQLGRIVRRLRASRR